MALLSVAYVLFGMKCYHLHEEYLVSLRKWWGLWRGGALRKMQSLGSSWILEGVVKGKFTMRRIITLAYEMNDRY